MCPAAEKKCKKCGKKGHFAKVCQSTKVEELSEEETYAISTVKRSASTQALVTFRVNNQHNVTFEIDTGALSIYGVHKGHRRSEWFRYQTREDTTNHAQQYHLVKSCCM